jgi:hypothetical protein
MDYFFNESSREKFSDLPFNGLTLVVGKPPQVLLLRRIRWFPCEYVSVSPKKADEREFLFITQARTDDGGLG